MALPHRSPALGATFALTGAALFGINGSMSKVVMAAGITPEQLTFARALATMLIAGAVLLVSDRAQFRVTRRELGFYALLGIAGLAMIQWLYSVAIARLPVGVALLFEYTAVVLVALTALLVFKERVHRRLWWAIGGVLLGLAVVAELWDSSLDGVGVLAGLGAATAYAFYFLAGERSVAVRPPLAVAFWASTFATAFWAAFSGWWRIDPALLVERISMDGALADIVLPLWVPLLWIVALGGFAPFVLIFMSLRHVNATAAGILASSEVLFAFLIAWLWLGETLAPLQLAGAAVVLVAIVVAQTARDREAAEVATPEVPPEVP
ncbi:EamA family transporter [Demequina maris]|uniref:EamA family transporter n=1 Tax=Demequina maris TaxID=1638982 RepID=UPI000785930B|nr:DMT family transporter [Demequina maris]